MRSSIISFILLVVTGLNSCKETYTPELNDPPKALIVEALITDEVREHTIKISQAVRFDSIGYIPERGATVFVSDGTGNLFYFNEVKAGTYVSDPARFKPQTGATYFLTIRTKNDKIYKSTGQTLHPKGDFAAISNVRKERKYSHVAEGKLVFFTVSGTQFLTSLDLTNDPNPYYRYSNTFLAEFFARTDTPKISYCWQKYNPNDFFNINDIKIQNTGVFQHDLGFCPVDSAFYGIFTREKRLPSGITIVIFNDLYKFFVSFKQYRLNKDVYEYYKSLNKQLEARQQIFDPIPFQSLGNIKCINDPEALVLGLFEVSSVNNFTFVINPVPNSTSYNLIPMQPVDMDTIPNMGNIPSSIPKFWIY